MRIGLLAELSQLFFIGVWLCFTLVPLGTFSQDKNIGLADVYFSTFEMLLHFLWPPFLIKKKKSSYSDCFPIIVFPWLLSRSLGVRNLITMGLHMDFLGFVLELRLEFTELHESLVSTCLCQIWNFFPAFFFFCFVHIG